MMPPAPSHVLRAGLRALSLPDHDDTVLRLMQFVELLVKWNARINLSAVRAPEQMVTHHLLDCLAVLPALDRRLGPRPARLLDVGSGAGLPGVVLALMRPAWQFSCVDAVAKKVAFVRQAAAELKLPNLRADHSRVEQLHTPPYDVIVSRAFASLADFTRLSAKLLAAGGCWLAMKGQVPDDEIAQLAGIDVFHVEPLSVPGLDARRCLVWMRPAA